MTNLRKYSLVERRIFPTRTLSLHPVVRLLLRASLSSQQSMLLLTGEAPALFSQGK